MTSPNIAALEQRLGVTWTSIRSAQVAATKRRGELAQTVEGLGSTDTSLVIFGSVARGEVTSQSDLDWILLIDGQSFPEHKLQQFEVERRLLEKRYIAPGSSGLFGTLVGSHELVHNIGGEDDLNSTTTRRVLLLLESCAVGSREAYDRVRRQILRRYLNDDRGLTHSSGSVRIPRFLLNDITRYWRTVTVDFVYKQVADKDRKWALRNAKLRMSRKLIFAAGLARVFLCHLDPGARVAQESLVGERDVLPMVAYLEKQLEVAPLELLAQLCLLSKAPDSTVRRIFDSYDQFLGILDDSVKRDELYNARSHEDLRSSAAWGHVRSISGDFHSGLLEIFLKDPSPVQELTVQYGLF